LTISPARKNFGQRKIHTNTEKLNVIYTAKKPHTLQHDFFFLLKILNIREDTHFKKAIDKYLFIGVFLSPNLISIRRSLFFLFVENEFRSYLKNR